MNVLGKFFIVLFFLNMSVGFSSAFDEEAQYAKIVHDIDLLLSIIARHDGDVFAYDAEYAKLGDPLVTFATKAFHETENLNEEHFKTIVEHYENDKVAGKLSSLRISWLGIQLSMTLSATPRRRPEVEGSPVTSHIEQLERHVRIINRSRLSTIPQWLLDFSLLENAEQRGGAQFFSVLKRSHFLTPVLFVYGESGSFSAKASLMAAEHGIFLLSLDPKTTAGHRIHGGVFKTTIEKTLHDFVHLTTQWFDQTFINSHKDFQMFKNDAPLIARFHRAHNHWMRFFHEVNVLLQDDSELSPHARGQLETIAFQIQHEGLEFQIPSLVHESDDSLLAFVHKAASLSREEYRNFLDYPDNEIGFYEKVTASALNRTRKFKHCDCKNGLEIIEIRNDKDIEYKTTVSYKLALNPAMNRYLEGFVNFTNVENYRYFKCFYRDLGYQLMRHNLWTSKTTVLGTTYPIEEIKHALFAAYDWFFVAIAADGVLYQRLHAP